LLLKKNQGGGVGKLTNGRLLTASTEALTKRKKSPEEVKTKRGFTNRKEGDK